MPPFAQIETRHYKPAFDIAMSEHLSELQSIANNPEPPTFENVFVPYDCSGRSLTKIQDVYSNMCLSKNTEEMKSVQKEMSPLLSQHASACYATPGLFSRIDAVFQSVKSDGSSLTSEQIRLIERVHLDFTRAGAKFDETKQKEYAALKSRLAELETEFMQNVMIDEEEWEMVLVKDDLLGCPQSLIDAMRQTAVERGRDEDGEEPRYILTLARSIVEPFLTYSQRRDLRRKACTAWTTRGEMSPERNNLGIAKEMLDLRRQQAAMHGCSSFAEWQCQDRMAQTPQRVMKLLEDVWDRAKLAANRERDALEDYVKECGDELVADEDGRGDGIEPWDWRYYAERVRKARYDFDETELKPYLTLDGITSAVMDVSNRLFGLRYVRRDDLETYHPDVVAYEVRQTRSTPSTTGEDDKKDDDEEEDPLVAIFLHDNYARPHKSSGAWMSEYRSQTRNLHPDASNSLEGIPIVSNNNNLARGGDGSPTLLSFDDANTVFHEMGHGHHGMLSDANYGRLASTNVLTDFVELPSQLMEHWLEEPEILSKHGRHYLTGEALPMSLVDRMMAAKNFNQGFATIEYTICALMDMALHSLESYDDIDLVQFERTELERLGMPSGIVMRHRPAHFLHLFASSHYAAGYYVYLWAEVLDADAYGAFQESDGGPFDANVAAKARQYIYGAGNTVAPDELFRLFRGRDPDITYMLKKKGLTNDAN